LTRRQQNSHSWRAIDLKIYSLEFTTPLKTRPLKNKKGISMTLAQILVLLQQANDAIVALQASQTTFSQADIDAAVAQAKADQSTADSAAVAAMQATIDSLNVQVTALQAQVDGIGPIVAGAVGAENARVLGIVKGLLDGEEAAVLAAMALPAPVAAPQLKKGV
jgi:hypothetical protein